MNFNAEKISEVIDDYIAIRIYVETKKNFATPEFKVLFNRFYKIRQKKAKWYNAFYNTFANYKRTPKSFKDLLMKFYKATEKINGVGKGEIHPSFCSKIMHAVDPNKPYWDKYILQMLGIVLDEPVKPYERIHYYAEIYSQIEKEYVEHLNDKNIKEAMQRFDLEIKYSDFVLRDLIKPKKNGKSNPKLIAYSVTDEFKLTSIEKLDLMLWSIKDERRPSILDYNKLLEE